MALDDLSVVGLICAVAGLSLLALFGAPQEVDGSGQPIGGTSPSSCAIGFVIRCSPWRASRCS